MINSVEDIQSKAEDTNKQFALLPNYIYLYCKCEKLCLNKVTWSNDTVLLPKSHQCVH